MKVNVERIKILENVMLLGQYNRDRQTCMVNKYLQQDTYEPNKQTSKLTNQPTTATKLTTYKSTDQQIRKLTTKEPINQSNQTPTNTETKQPNQPTNQSTKPHLPTYQPKNLPSKKPQRANNLPTTTSQTNQASNQATINQLPTMQDANKPATQQPTFLPVN